MLAVVALVATGCSNQRDVGVRYVKGRSLEFFIPLCGDEQVQGLRVEDITDLHGVGDGVPVWTLQAGDGSGDQLREVAFGSVPSGYHSEGLTSLDELVSKFGNRQLRVDVATDRDGGLVTAFAMTQMPNDGSAIFDGRAFPSSAALAAALRDECSPNSAEEALTTASRIAVAVVAIGGCAWLLHRRRSRRDRHGA